MHDFYEFFEWNRIYIITIILGLAFMIMTTIIILNSPNPSCKNHGGFKLIDKNRVVIEKGIENINAIVCNDGFSFREW